MSKRDQYKNSRRSQLNIGNNYSDIYAKKKSIPKDNKNNTTLTHNSISSQNEKEQEEKILLLTQLKPLNGLSTTNKYAALTNLKLCLYISKAMYLFDKENPYKVFKLKEYNFEINNNILLIQRKEHKAKTTEKINKSIEKYEISNKETASKWHETLLKICDILSLDSTKNNNDEKETLKKSDDDYSANKEMNEKIEDNKAYENENENNKDYNETSKSNYQSDISYIREEEEENNKDSDNEKDNIKIKKEKGSKNKSNNLNDKKEIKIKPSFRCLLKEEINKVEKELFNNNASDIKNKISDKEPNKNSICDKKFNYLLPSVNNSNKNIYSFGKQSNLNSFHHKNSIIENKLKINDEKNSSLNSSNINKGINKSDIPNQEKEEDFSESNDIKIKDLSKNDITQNDMFNEKNSFMNDGYSKNTNILVDENNLKNSFIEKSTCDIIKLINCEKNSRSKSDSIFELSNSNKENSNNEKGKEKKNEEINPFIHKDIKRNNIKSSFLSKNRDTSKEINKNQDDYNYDDKNKSITKANYSNMTNNSKNYKIEGESFLDDAIDKLKYKLDYINNLVIEKENEKKSNHNNAFSNNSNNNIEQNNANNNNLIKNDQFNDINEIKIFEKSENKNDDNIDNNFPNFNTSNNSLLNSPKVKDFTLEKNSNERKKIFLFSNESNIKKDKNEYEYENECSYDFSNDIYTNIYENKTLSNQKTYKNKKNKKDFSLSRKDSGSSLIIIEKTLPLLTKSMHSNNLDKNGTKIEKVENLNIDYEKQIKIFKNINIERQGYFSLIRNSNKSYIINEINSNRKNKNNKHVRRAMSNSISDKKMIWKKAFIQNDNNALNRYSSKKQLDSKFFDKNIKKYKNNNFISITDMKCFEIQKIVEFYIEQLNIDLFNIDGITQDTLINNINRYYKKNGKMKFKNKSVDSKKSSNYKNYINANKGNTTNKNIYKKKINNLKKSLLIEKLNYTKNEEPFSIKNHSRHFSLNYDYEPFYKDEFIDSIDTLNADTFSLTNNTTYLLNKNNKAFVSSLHSSKEIKSNKYTPKRLDKFINKKNENELNYHLSPIKSLYNEKCQNYSLPEKNLNFKQITNNKENGKDILIKLIENILHHKYSKEMLLYCFNKGMSMTTFLPVFQESLELILQNNKDNYEIILKDLLDIVPKLIRNRLEKRDLKSFFMNNNILNDCYAKDYIKRLIINDIRYLVYIFNKYYDCISSIIVKNNLYKNKNIFIQEMKSLTADIIFS